MKLARILVAAGLLALSGAASAAPVTGLPSADHIGVSGIVKVHDGNTHRDCQEGRRGWHRHDRYGERIPCNAPSYGRPHHHQGYAPPVYAPRQRCYKDYHCEKSGPFGINKRCYWRDLCN